MTSYQISNHFRFRTHGDKAFIWHSLRGEGCVVSTEALNLLLNNRISINTDSKSFLDRMVKKGLILYDSLEKEAYRPKFVPNGISFNLTKKCNFSCQYCISNEFLSEGIDSYLRFEKIVDSIDNYCEKCKKIPEADTTIAFNGGECLLYFNELKRVIEYCNSKYGKNVLHYRINTNASLITDNIASFMKENNIRVFTSLDGPLEYNDRIRIKNNGDGTYNDIVTGLSLLKKNEVEFFINTVITEKNILGINNEYISYLVKNFGIKSIGIDIDLLHIYNYTVKDITELLIGLQEDCNKNGIALVGMYQSPFKNLKHSEVYFCGAQTGNSLSIDVNGSIILCAFLPIVIANDINEYFEAGFSGRIIRQIESIVAMNRNECNGCDFEKACNAGCLAVYKQYREKNNKDIFNFVCQLYRNMTEYYIKKLLTSSL